MCLDNFSVDLPKLVFSGGSVYQRQNMINYVCHRNMRVKFFMETHIPIHVPLMRVLVLVSAQICFAFSLEKKSHLL
jgi:hypothetical protein